MDESHHYWVQIFDLLGEL